MLARAPYSGSDHDSLSRAMTTAEEIVEVRPHHRFDEAALARHLGAVIDGWGEHLVVRQFEGGQSNPTFLLETGDRRWVLRKKPPGKLLPTAHMVEREYRVMKALETTDVPVPRMLHLCEETGVIGTAFFVMEYVPGRMFEDPGFPGVTADARRELMFEMMRVLARLHAVDIDDAGLSSFGKGSGYVERQIRRWTQQYEASKTDALPAMESLIEWLPKNVPEDDTVRIVHGDYRPHNLIFHPTEPRALALLDWELSTLGHPLSDLAYHCIPFHLGSPPLADRSGPETGIPTESDYVAEYCRHAGRAEIPHWSFYLAFSLFRSASILQGVYRRGLDGNASSERALQKKDAVVQSAEAGWRVARES